jgi:multiple sugar transport system ATP-binding protein
MPVEAIMANIKLVGVTKRFGQVVAIDALDMEIRDKELLGVVGPSGCGKTTLLRLIAGLEDQDSGEIYIDGKPSTAIKPQERGIQLVFQSFALWPHMKVFDKDKFSNLSLPMRIRNWIQEEVISRVRQVNSSVGVDETLHDRKPTELSAGQKQRVALGRALVVAPKALLLDEPMSNLDPPSRIKIRGELRRLHDEYGMTTVLVTHNIIDAVAIADRMAIMKDGRILQIGKTKEVYERPVNSFVADFIRCYDAASILRQVR